MDGWHQQLDGHKFEQALGVGDGQGTLACCSAWDHKESDTSEHLSTHTHKTVKDHSQVMGLLLKKQPQLDLVHGPYVVCELCSGQPPFIQNEADP